MKKTSFLACFLFFLANSCFLDSHHGNPTVFQETGHAFPDTFIEKGSDSDTSYLSIKVTNQPDSSLQIDCAGWGIYETGMMLWSSHTDSIYDVRLMGYCGTIETRTWVKDTLSQTISKALIDSISMILYANARDTIAISRHR